MRIAADQTDERSLSCLGEEVIALLGSGNFEALANRFGYALSFGRDPATAIEADLIACRTAEVECQKGGSPAVSVKYFKTNDTNLVALVECVTQVADDLTVLVELIVTGKGADLHITLEDITRARV